MENLEQYHKQLLWSIMGYILDAMPSWYVFTLNVMIEVFAVELVL